MQKNRRIVSISLSVITIILILVLSACASSNTKGNTAPNAQANQRPEMMGQVTAIAGNQVTIKVIEIPAMPSGSPGQQPANGKNNPSPAPSGSAGQSPVQSGGQNPATTSLGAQKQRGYSFTGEEKTIVIPVGVNITSIQRTTSTSANAQGNSSASVQTVTMDFKDIKVGDIISIWYSEKDSTAIARISISSSTSTTGQNAGFPGGDFPGGGQGGGPPAGGPGGN